MSTAAIDQPPYHGRELMLRRLLDGDTAQHILASMVPVRYAGPHMLQLAGKPEPKRIAVIQLDITDRPDLADLARVMRSEGLQPRLSNPVMYNLGDNAAMLLSLQMSAPVEIDATVIIPWSMYREFFFLLQELGVVYVALGAMEDLLTNSFALHLRIEELSIALAAWQS
jgi:hypothetical protein